MFRIGANTNHLSNVVLPSTQMTAGHCVHVPAGACTAITFLSITQQTLILTELSCGDSGAPRFRLPDASLVGEQA